MKNVNIMMSPRIIISNGEQASVKSVVSSPFLVGFEQLAEHANQPEIRIVEEGITVNLQPVLRSDENDIDFFVLDCQLEDRRVLAAKWAELVRADGSPSEKVQVPEVETIRINSSLNFPVGKSIVFSTQVKNDEGDNDHLLVFLSCEIAGADANVRSPGENDAVDLDDSPSQSAPDSSDWDSKEPANPAQKTMESGNQPIFPFAPEKFDFQIRSTRSSSQPKIQILEANGQRVKIEGELKYVFSNDELTGSGSDIDFLENGSGLNLAGGEGLIRIHGSELLRCELWETANRKRQLILLR